MESGAAVFASTISDIATAADKCEETEEGYIQCSQFLYGTWGVLARGGGPSPGRGAAGPGRSPLPFWEPPAKLLGMEVTPSLGLLPADLFEGPCCGKILCLVAKNRASVWMRCLWAVPLGGLGGCTFLGRAGA